jgi:hypothetical protein
MIFSLEVRRARKGDCLLIHYGTCQDPGLILIDGGPALVYESHLKPRLHELRAARRLNAHESLLVDLLVVSHIDDDHIKGILEMTGELVQARNAKQPLPLKIRSCWHNTFDEIIGNDASELRAAVTAAFGPASLHGDPDVEGLDPAAAMVLASLDQGLRLRDDMRRLSIRVNPEFDGKPVTAGEGRSPIDIGKGLTFTVIGPMEPELRALQKAHDAFLQKRARDRTRAGIAAFTDASVANLSSIVVIATAGRKRMLLTGDARGDKILAGLERAGALESDGGLHVDVLKLPHHGSDRNIAREFLERITADHYVVSANGEHGNPERATLEMLAEARPQADYTIHFTYDIEALDEERRSDWNMEREKELRRQRTNPGARARAPWSAPTHSLAAFVEAHPAMADGVRVVDPVAPHVIDLLDPVES